MKVRLLQTAGFIPAIKGMRLSMRSESDTTYEEIGEKDMALMLKLIKAGDSHSAFLRMIQAWIYVDATRSWWHQWDKYKFQHFMTADIEERSSSTMHTIADDELRFDSHTSIHVIENVKALQDLYNRNDPIDELFIMLKYSLPEGLLQDRIINLNYQTLRTIYHDRKNHRLPEWRELCEFIETMPYKELMIGG